MMNETNIQFPQMRRELIEVLSSLSDRDYQERVWVAHKLPIGRTPETFYDSFDLAVHFLFDDTRLGDDPQSTIGSILINESEAEAIKKLIGKIDQVIKVVGKNADDKKYIDSKGWSEVVSAAKTALDLIARSRLASR
jgi:hypothetical protein